MTTFAPSSRIDSATRTLCWGNTGYAGIPRALIRHPNFALLKGNAVKLLLAMLSGYVGNNNGELIATFPVMKTYGFNSKDSVAKALSELMKAGLIIRTRLSGYRRPATYAVTWLPLNKPGARGPYDVGVSPSDVAEDRWRIQVVSSPSATDGEAPSTSSPSPSSSADSLSAPLPDEVAMAVMPEAQPGPAASVSYDFKPVGEHVPEPSPGLHADVSCTPEKERSPRERWPEIRDRWHARRAAERQMKEEQIRSIADALAATEVSVAASG